MYFLLFLLCFFRNWGMLLARPYVRRQFEWNIGYQVHVFCEKKCLGFRWAIWSYKVFFSLRIRQQSLAPESSKSQGTRWFKVSFWSPSWRSLNPLNGSLNHPKKVTLNSLNHQVVSISETFLKLPVFFLKNPGSLSFLDLQSEKHPKGIMTSEKNLFQKGKMSNVKPSCYIEWNGIRCFFFVAHVVDVM